MNFKTKQVDYLSLGLSIIAAGYILLYLFTVSLRLFYPYELEWMEGALLTNSLHIYQGKALYSAPSAEFIPYLYTPLYTYVVALVMNFTGVNFLAGRLVSILSSLLCTWLLYRIIKRETNNSQTALISAGFFLASYRFTGTWMDIVRVDTFQLFLLVLGFYLLRYYLATVWGVYAAAGVFSLAFFSKQSAPIFIIAAGSAIFFSHRKKSLIFLLSCCLFSGVGIWMANYFSHGWFLFYTYKILKAYKFKPKYFFEIFLPDLKFNLPFILALITGWYLYEIINKFKNGLPFFWTRAFFAGFLSSIMMRSKDGGYTNSFLTLCYFAPLLTGLIWDKAQRCKAYWRYLIAGLVLCQFGLFAYKPFHQAPNAQDKTAGEILLKRIAAFPGPVLVASHPYYSIMAGKEMTMHDMALYDAMLISDLPPDLADNIRSRRYSAIILDQVKTDNGQLGMPDFLPLDLVKKGYYRAETIFPLEDDRFYPVAGYQVRPQFIYLPKE
ncbi:MAG: glycosyltransferase family 39 protein [Candidatus Schekmanbacteria bacterium]|nr:glycosyltransferase family 39 protein [Candidatus Schekmanbacteria bacterium]